MTLKEFNEKFLMHDSVIEHIERRNGDLLIYCGFCNFMQKSYTEISPANSDIVLTFRNAVYSITDGFNVNDAGFLTQKLSGETLVFGLENEPGIYGEISIQADSVEIEVIRTYNL